MAALLASRQCPSCRPPPAASVGSCARQQRCARRVRLLAAASAGGDEATPAPAPAPAAAPLGEDGQQQSVTIPAPLGPTEPANEEKKKLSPQARLSEDLASTSITIVGDDTELNWAVCQALSKKIGWFGVSTSKVLLGMHKAAGLQEFAEREGRDGVAKAEAAILAGMKDQLRCCVATIGDAAAADAATYPNLFGTIIIWLDEQDRRSPKPPSAARRLYAAHAEVRAALSAGGGGFGDRALPLEDKAQRAAAQLVKALNELLKKDDLLLARKRAYVELGCRGDWPQLQPPEWNPVLDGLRGERQRPAEGEAEEEQAVGSSG